MAAAETWTQIFARRAATLSDDSVLRWLLRGLIAGTLVVAALSWYLVEKPALGLKRRLMGAS